MFIIIIVIGDIWTIITVKLIGTALKLTRTAFYLTLFLILSAVTGVTALIRSRSHDELTGTGQYTGHGPPRRTIRRAAVGALLLALMALLVTGSGRALAQASSVAISPAQGLPGTEVTATGSNWGAGDQIQAIWGDTTGPDVGSTVTVNSSGDFTLTFDVPSGAAPGSYQVIFWDENEQYFIPASEDFTVTQSTPSSPPSSPAAPSNLKVTPEGPLDFHLTWTSNSTNQSGFQVYNGVTAETVAANQDSYVWAVGHPGTYMCFAVRADNSSGYSAWAGMWTCATTPAGEVMVGQTATFAGNGHGKSSFIPGQAIKYGVNIANPGNIAVTVTVTAKISGPQTLFQVTGTVSVTPGPNPRWYVFSGRIPNLAPFGTYTNSQTVAVDGATYVRRSTITLGDPRLVQVLAWISARNGDRTVTHGSTPIPVNDYCEEVNEWAYGWFGGTTDGIGYSNAHLDYEAQLVAGRIHSESNSDNSTAPAGALVFFTGADPATGHIGIAVGDGKHYWTTDGTIHVASLTEGDGYLGWCLAPLNWPG